MSSISSRAYNIFDLREMAQRRLPRGIFEFVDRGAEDEVTLNDSLTWEDVRVLRELWPGKLALKGILHPQDAVTAVRYGVDAVVVSNHGGRTVDGAVAPIEVLPNIVDAVGDRMTVIVDSGFRRGSDVVKALALGAKAVLIGRSTLYGVAADGEPGAARAIAIFREEIDRVLALLGCRSIAELSRAYLVLPETMREPAAAGHRVGLRLLDSARAAGEM